MVINPKVVPIVLSFLFILGIAIGIHLQNILAQKEANATSFHQDRPNSSRDLRHFLKIKNFDFNQYELEETLIKKNFGGLR